MGYVYVRVADADGDPAWRIFSLYVAGGPGALLDSDFRGDRSRNAHTVDAGVLPGSRRRAPTRDGGSAPEPQGRAGNDRLAWSQDMPAEPSTLAQAVAENEYVAHDDHVVADFRHRPAQGTRALHHPAHRLPRATPVRRLHERGWLRRGTGGLHDAPLRRDERAPGFRVRAARPAGLRHGDVRRGAHLRLRGPVGRPPHEPVGLLAGPARLGGVVAASRSDRPRSSKTNGTTTITFTVTRTER